MIAKIVTQDKEYYSYVFARFESGFYEKVIVFDDEKEKFEILNVYKTKPSLKRTIFIIDTDTNGMINKDKIKISLLTTFKDCIGYEWIINNDELIGKIMNNTQVDEEYIEKAKDINKQIEVNEWNYINNEKDVKDLLHASWGFHDAILQNISYNLKDNYDTLSSVQVLFTGCWECDILLEFQGDILIHYNIDDNNSYEIMDSNIIFADGYIYWIDEYIEDIKEINDNYIYFRGRSLKWKMITKK